MSLCELRTIVRTVKVIASGEGLQVEGCSREGIDSVKTNAPSAAVVDNTTA